MSFVVIATNGIKKRNSSNTGWVSRSILLSQSGSLIQYNSKIPFEQVLDHEDTRMLLDLFIQHDNGKHHSKVKVIDKVDGYNEISIISSDKTLRLRFPSDDIKKRWLQAFRYCLVQLNQHLSNNATTQGSDSTTNLDGTRTDKTAKNGNYTPLLSSRHRDGLQSVRNSTLVKKRMKSSTDTPHTRNASSGYDDRKLNLLNLSESNNFQNNNISTNNPKRRSSHSHSEVHDDDESELIEEDGLDAYVKEQEEREKLHNHKTTKIELLGAASVKFEQAVGGDDDDDDDGGEDGEDEQSGERNDFKNSTAHNNQSINNKSTNLAQNELPNNKDHKSPNNSIKPTLLSKHSSSLISIASIFTLGFFSTTYLYNVVFPPTLITTDQLLHSTTLDSLAPFHQQYYHHYAHEFDQSVKSTTKSGQTSPTNHITSYLSISHPQHSLKFTFPSTINLPSYHPTEFLDFSSNKAQADTISKLTEHLQDNQSQLLSLWSPSYHTIPPTQSYLLDLIQLINKQYNQYLTSQVNGKGKSKYRSTPSTQSPSSLIPPQHALHQYIITKNAFNELVQRYGLNFITTTLQSPNPHHSRPTHQAGHLSTSLTDPDLFLTTVETKHNDVELYQHNLLALLAITTQSHLDTLFSLSLDELKTWYEQHQAEIVAVTQEVQKERANQQLDSKHDDEHDKNGHRDDDDAKKQIVGRKLKLTADTPLDDVLVQLFAYSGFNLDDLYYLQHFEEHVMPFYTQTAPNSQNLHNAPKFPTIPSSTTPTKRQLMALEGTILYDLYKALQYQTYISSNLLSTDTFPAFPSHHFHHDVKLIDSMVEYVETELSTHAIFPKEATLKHQLLVDQNLQIAAQYDQKYHNFRSIQAFVDTYNLSISKLPPQRSAFFYQWVKPALTVLIPSSIVTAVLALIAYFGMKHQDIVLFNLMDNLSWQIGTGAGVAALLAIGTLLFRPFPFLCALLNTLASTGLSVYTQLPFFTDVTNLITNSGDLDEDGEHSQTDYNNSSFDTSFSSTLDAYSSADNAQNLTYATATAQQEHHDANNDSLLTLRNSFKTANKPPQPSRPTRQSGSQIQSIPENAQFSQNYNYNYNTKRNNQDKFAQNDAETNSDVSDSETTDGEDISQPNALAQTKRRGSGQFDQQRHDESQLSGKPVANTAHRRTSVSKRDTQHPTQNNPDTKLVASSASSRVQPITDETLLKTIYTLFQQNYSAQRSIVIPKHPGSTKLTTDEQKCVFYLHQRFPKFLQITDYDWQPGQWKDIGVYDDIPVQKNTALSPKSEKGGCLLARGRKVVPIPPELLMSLLWFTESKPDYDSMCIGVQSIHDVNNHINLQRQLYTGQRICNDRFLNVIAGWQRARWSNISNPDHQTLLAKQSNNRNTQIHSIPQSISPSDIHSLPITLSSPYWFSTHFQQNDAMADTLHTTYRSRVELFGLYDTSTDFSTFPASLSSSPQSPTAQLFNVLPLAQHAHPFPLHSSHPLPASALPSLEYTEDGQYPLLDDGFYMLACSPNGEILQQTDFFKKCPPKSGQSEAFLFSGGFCLRACLIPLDVEQPTPIFSKQCIEHSKKLLKQLPDSANFLQIAKQNGQKYIIGTSFIGIGHVSLPGLASFIQHKVCVQATGLVRTASMHLLKDKKNPKVNSVSTDFFYA